MNEEAKAMSNRFEIEGRIKSVGLDQVFGSGFVKRELVLVVGEDGKYPQELAFEFVKDNVSQLDGIVAGLKAKVWFNVIGREYNGKHYVNLHGWKVETEAVTSAPSEAAPPPCGKQGVSKDVEGDYGEDIPF